MRGRLLFVEGKGDGNVIYAIAQHNCIGDKFEIESEGSDGQAKLTFEIYVNENASKVKSIGIVIDADLSATSRWQSIRNILIETNNYTVPKDIPTEGLVLEPNKENKPRVGVWIMPNNKDKGMLEDFLALLTKENDPVLGFVDETIEKLKEKGLQKFSERHKAKARIHTYLAWQKDPGSDFANAVNKKYFDSDSEIAKLFANWLKRLFLE